MANRPFEYRIINPLERPKSEDLNLAQAQAHADARFVVGEMFGLQDGFLGDGFLVGVSPVDPTQFVRTTPGGFFQTKGEELNINGIPGLNDVLAYKATTISNLDIYCQPPPTGADEKRYDLIQVRPLTGTERLIEPETVDILNPALQSFVPQPSLPKTLTASFTPGVLAGLLPGYTNIDVPVTAPMSYVTGAVTATTDWAGVVKPGIVPGYLAVVYIKRYAGQTEITAADIEDVRTLLKLPINAGGTGYSSLPAGEVLLGNGTNAIDSVAVLPMSKGGTGRAPTSGDPNGSVAYLDSVTDQIKYTQAVTGLYDTPVSGYLMFSNASGAPTWAPQSLHYSANHTGLYTNNTIAWTQITALTLTDVALRAGVVRIQLQPYNSLDEEDFSIGTNVDASGGAAMIKFEISGATSRVFIFPYTLGANNDSSLALPSFDVVVNAGDHTVKVWGKVKQVTTTLFVQKCALVASQG